MTTATSELILESMPLGMVAIDNEMTVVRYNEAASKIMGKPVHEVIGFNMDEVFNPHPEERVIQLTLEKQVEFTNYEVPLQIQGQTVWVMMNTKLIRGEQGDVRGATMLFSDITAVKEMEQHMVRSARLVTIGEMAAGAAHEIRNPLTVIKGFLQLWHSQNGTHPYLPLIFGEIDQIDRIVQQFLHLGKKEQHFLPAQRLFDLQESIADLTNLCRSEAVLKGIELICEHNIGTLPVNINRTEWKQMLVNLIRNAFDAFECEQTNKQVSMIVRKRRDHAVVYIVDNGKGMSRQTLQKVRTAFYTTKENGTGLGLSI
ncbi:MAG: two-component system sensor histidine kinase NtrB, partial [Tumebacillaceae bacterium]